MPTFDFLIKKNLSRNGLKNCDLSLLCDITHKTDQFLCVISHKD